jgi:sporulation protein YlmC with PRC-barrel domain
MLYVDVANKYFYVKNYTLYMEIFMKPHEIYGKKVFTFKGIHLGEIDGIEVDENNWAITDIDVKLTNDAEKLFDLKSGMTHKSIMPIPVNLFGPIGLDRVTLTEVVADPKELVARVTKVRGR